MRRGIAAIAALAIAGALAGESGAQDLSSDTIMGRWCSDAGSYHFTADKLTVSSVRGGQSVLRITSIVVDGSRIIVGFAEDDQRQSRANRGQGSYTTFSEFSGGQMVQVSETRDDGTRTPNRVFRRC